MEPIGINYLSVLVAGVAYMVLGAIWYSSAIFGKAWMKGIGKTKEQVTKNFSVISYIWTLIASFVLAYGVARIMLWHGTTSIGGGVLVGVLVGVCFVLTTFSINDSFERRPLGLTIGNILYHMIGLAIVGIIIAAWK